MNKLNEDFTNLYKRWKSGKERKENKFDYELVDLGLPSGTLWMDRNIGADTPYNTGGYYAWGETEEKDEYTLDNYKFGNSGDLTKYNKEDGKTELEHEDDVVYLKTKGECHIPTKKQIEELITNTDKKWVEDYNGSGVNGGLFKSRTNDNFIFIPAAGYQDGTSVKERGNSNLWSASLADIYPSAYILRSFYSGTNRKFIGCNMRGVLG